MIHLDDNEFFGRIAHSPASRRSLFKGMGVASVAGALAITTGRRAPLAAQEATPVGVVAQLDVAYGEVDGQQLLLDIVSHSAHAELRPAVVLFHGGGFVTGTRSGVPASIAPFLADAGYVAFNVDERLFSEEDGSNPWPAQLDDAQRAIRWVRANAATYGIDPERVASFGISSGGQLAAFLGSRDTRDDTVPELAGISSRAQCVVDISGPMDMTIPSIDSEQNSINAKLLGGSVDQPPNEAAYLDLSPIAFVDEQTSPMLILHGSADATVSVDQSRRMVAALQSEKVEYMAGEFAGRGHRDMFDWAVIGPATLAFLGRYLTSE